MTATPLPVWVSILLALATPATALFVAFVAYQQWRTARDKLKLDLFDRSWAVHSAAVKLIAKVTSDGKIELKDEIEFLEGIQQARWILNKAIADYFEKELWPQMTKLQELNATSNSLGVDPGENARKTTETKNLIIDQREKLDCMFDPFLKLRRECWLLAPTVMRRSTVQP